MENNNSLINAFKQEFSSSVNSIFVNSLKDEVKFREITVAE